MLRTLTPDTAAGHTVVRGLTLTSGRLVNAHIERIDGVGFDGSLPARFHNEAGDIEFAVDQQPYLQGYLAVDSLWLYKNNGNYSGGGEAPVLTGPAFVDKDNVDTIASFAAKGTR